MGGKETHVDMWLLTVRRGTPGGRNLTRWRRAWGLWTEVELRQEVTVLAKAPTAKTTSARGIPPRYSARPAHSIILLPIQHTNPIDRSVSNEEERKKEESTARLRRREIGALEARPLSPPVPSSYDSPVYGSGGPKGRLARDYSSVLSQAQSKTHYKHGLKARAQS